MFFVQNKTFNFPFSIFNSKISIILLTVTKCDVHSVVAGIIKGISINCFANDL